MVSTATVSRATTVAAAFLGLLPDGRLKRYLLRTVLGWDIDRSARVAPCVFLGVKHISLGPGSGLAAFSVYRDLELLALETNSGIGHWNYVTAARELRTDVLDATPDTRPATLELEHNAVITSRHYIDCSGGVSVGAFAVLAGVRSTVMSHEVDLVRSAQSIASVRIGSHCFVASNVLLAPGSCTADRSFIAMGALVAGDLRTPEMLYAGVPARPIKNIGNVAFFSRTSRAKVP